MLDGVRLVQARWRGMQARHQLEKRKHVRACAVRSMAIEGGHASSGRARLRWGLLRRVDGGGF